LARDHECGRDVALTSTERHNPSRVGVRSAEQLTNPKAQRVNLLKLLIFQILPLPEICSKSPKALAKTSPLIEAGDGAGTMSTDVRVPKNRILADRDKKQHSDDRGLDGKWLCFRRQDVPGSHRSGCLRSYGSIGACRRFRAEGRRVGGIQLEAEADQGSWGSDPRPLGPNNG
jgi:hypothetical protein